MTAKFKAGDEIAMSGTVSRVPTKNMAGRRVTVRLNGFDYPLTVDDQYVELVGRAEQPAAKKPARRKGPLFDVPD